jgi:hypothetical protein
MRETVRRTDLDWVRIGAFAILIFYHVAVFYSPIPNIAHSPRTLAWVQVPMLFTSPWRLLVLFIVSGAATRFMSAKLGPATLARMRTIRLLLPLIFGVMVIVPPQSFTQVIEQYGYHGNFLSFWGRYLHADRTFCRGGHCLVLPTWNHLWFVAYLWTYTVVFVPALMSVPGLQATMQRWLERSLSGWGLLIWPVAYLALARLVLEPSFPQNYAISRDWYAHAVFVAGFLLGFLLARSEGVWESFERMRWPGLAGGMIAYGVIVGGAMATMGLNSNWDAETIARHHASAIDWFDSAGAIVWAVDQWFFTIAIFGFARRHLSNRDGSARRYLTDAIFPFYIVHQTTIVVAGHYLVRQRLPLGLEASMLIAATVASCFIAYEVVRRIGPLRPMFGLKSVIHMPQFSTVAAQ